MAVVSPFYGWRYTTADQADALLAPPYDVIGPAERKALAAHHPHNVVHLILPQAEAGLSAYERAAALLHRWQAEGVIRQDETPSLYLLYQRFRLPDGRTLERRGLIAALRLAPWGQGILPHERTFPQAKADRLALLKAIGLEDSPIFTLTPDPDGALRERLRTATARPPDLVYHDDEGTHHALWQETDPDLIAALCRLLADRTLYVADGHHRYETALAYQVWRQEQAPTAAGAAHDFCLAYVTALEDPGVVILPTHRLIVQAPGLNPERLLTALAADFDRAPLADDEALIAAIGGEPPGAPTFGLILAGQPPYLLRLRSHPAQRRVLLAAYPEPVAALPTAILQVLILGPHFGIGSDPAVQKTQLRFTADARAAVAHVRAGHGPAAVLTTPTSLAQLRALADAGCVAPPKSTYFYPKLPSGLVFYQAGPVQPVPINRA